MIYCYYISVSLILVILQTTIIPHLPLLNRCYDLLIPFIIYLGLARPTRESIPCVLFMGLIMDNLSGSPFGLYITTYLWLYVGVRGITKMLQVGQRLLIVALLVVAGVLIENLIFFSTFRILESQSRLSAEAYHQVVYQVIWAICTGPLMLLLFRNMQKRLNAGLKGFFNRQDKQKGTV
ncbi:MAG: rod shape-determining protein MreD [Desulfobacterales bacterium]|jgi:rod shape-determining protein MreD